MSPKFHEALLVSRTPVSPSNGRLANIERCVASLPKESEAVFVFALATGGANTTTPLCKRMKRTCNARR